MAARLKRAAYGLNDAPRLWWNRLDGKLLSYGLILTRADRCCCVLYGIKTSRQLAGLTDLRRPDLEVWEANFADRASDSEARRASDLEARALTWKATETKMNRELDIDGALELLLDPITGSKAHNKDTQGVVSIHVDDAFMSGNPTFKKKIMEALRKDFQGGSEDLNDVLFVGQRVKWIDRLDGKKKHIRVDQETKVEELAEINFDKSLRDDITCTRDLHTQYRSLLGQINWLQSRTQFQSCYLFSRCASASANPTIQNVRELNKLARKIRAEVVMLRF